MQMKFQFTIALVLLGTIGFTQKLKKADKAVIASLQNHIRFLADDKLEGRRAGSPGEALAADYISKQFQLAGLQPKGEKNTWLQPFPINDGKEIKPATSLTINGTKLKLNSEYFPFVFSANASVEATPAISLREYGVPWFIDLKDWIEDNSGNPHFDLSQKISEQVNLVASKGATALFLYNSSEKPDGLAFEPKNRTGTVKIPVIYLMPDAVKKYLSDASASLETKLTVDIAEKVRTGHNVVGYLDNGAANTVILGAHYDHLGHGQDGNSMVRNDFTQIHNGADDNASGIAALIELAKMLKASKLKSNNYLFIAFSGEELGLFGSKYFTEHPSVDLSKSDYMINMDMVGRLNDTTKVLTIGGVGTSPSWISTISSVPNKYFVVKYDSSGTGPSDHTSFYRKDIPVLFFFTGAHRDYHRPTDDADKINYTGEYMIIKYIYAIIEKKNKGPKLVFAKTREPQTTPTRMNVTMGIMPDYTFGGTGVRVDGVTDNRPAQKAGLKVGDVIVQLGNHSVTSVESYVQALNNFKKGDFAKVKFKRGAESLEATVQF